MKRGIIALSILCTGLLLLDPLKNISFASKDDIMDKEISSNISNTIEENDKIENTIDEKISINEASNEDIVKEEIVKQDVITEDSSDESYIEEKEDDTVTEEIIVNQENKVLSKDLAHSILIGMNPELEYLYQGDETTFPVLKENNLSGYVFLPNVDGDMGYFVDKSSSDVYLFHPSGYLELVK